MTLAKENLRRKNFSPDEFFNSDTIYRLNHDADPDNNIINYPSKNQELAVLTALMSNADAMQEMRDVLYAEWKKRKIKQGQSFNEKDFYLKILSAYRCPELNKLVKGKPNSKHILGLADDFICPAFGTPEEIVKYLHSISFLADQCLVEGGWVHYSRCLPRQVMGSNPNRMMYGYYLLDKKTDKRKFKSL